MKIVVDARTMGSRPSGVGMYLFDFLKELVKYQEFEFILLSDVATSEYISYFINLGMEVHIQGQEVYKSAGVYAYFGFIQSQLDKIKPDLFWEVNTIIPIKLNGKHKTMITIHDMFPITDVKYFGIIYSLYFRYNLKKTLKYTDMILYNSNQTEMTTEKIFPCAKVIKKNIAYIISNPLTKQFTVEDHDYFLYLGNMEKRKGVDLLIKGYKCYREHGGTKKLILAGKMQESYIDKAIKNAQLKIDDIKYMDYVSHDKKYELFANCSCFVFPSKAEGFGIPVIEAMKFNKPIIVSNLSIYDELFDKCINEFNIDCDEKDQIEKLADCMLNYNSDVDKEKYAQIINKFAPEKLGEVVRTFITYNI